MKAMTHEEFLSRLQTKFEGRLVVVEGKYINNQTPVKVHCNACGLERPARPNRLLTEKGACCPRCSGKERQTTETFQQRVTAAAGPKYEVTSEYAGVNRHVRMKHTTCGHEWNVTPSNFLHVGTRCPKCSHPAIFCISSK